MQSNDEKMFGNLNQTIICLTEGRMDSAFEIFKETEPLLANHVAGSEFAVNLRKFIDHYQKGASFISAVANGNLNVDPPEDKQHENYLISQYKQLQSNLLHLTWQAGQLAKGDLQQKVYLLGEFSVRFNSLIDVLREKRAVDNKVKTQFEHLQKLNAEKDKFYSIIAHDMRGPFFGFLGLTELITEDTEGMSMESVQKIANTMRESAINLFRLLEDLLEWTRIEQGLIPYSPEYINLLSLIEESLAPLTAIADVKSISVVREINREITVLIDKNMFSTIIRNLVSNAVKFTPNGGQIIISAKNEVNNFFRISVTDNGIGMDRILVENLFKLGANTRRKGTNGEQSTGFGLILCKEFVEKHNGQLWLESEEGKGSTFHFTVPYIT